MPEDLITWLRVQLDDVERTARAVQHADWVDTDSWVELDPAVVAHARRHDPSSVLRRIESDRRILDGCAETLAGEDAWDPQTDGGTSEPYDLARFVLRSLALPYADRSGFRPEWRPK